jgi:hypothetical protein
MKTFTLKRCVTPDCKRTADHDKHGRSKGATCPSCRKLLIRLREGGGSPFGMTRAQLEMAVHGDVLPDGRHDLWYRRQERAAISPPSTAPEPAEAGHAASGPAPGSTG